MRPAIDHQEVGTAIAVEVGGGRRRIRATGHVPGRRARERRGTVAGSGEHHELAGARPDEEVGLAVAVEVRGRGVRAGAEMTYVPRVVARPRGRVLRTGVVHRDDVTARVSDDEVAHTVAVEIDHGRRGHGPDIDVRIP